MDIQVTLVQSFAFSESHSQNGILNTDTCEIHIKDFTLLNTDEIYEQEKFGDLGKKSFSLIYEEDNYDFEIDIEDLSDSEIEDFEYNNFIHLPQIKEELEVNMLRIENEKLFANLNDNVVINTDFSKQIKRKI